MRLGIAGASGVGGPLPARGSHNAEPSPTMMQSLRSPRNRVIGRDWQMKRQPAISVLDVADDDWELLEYVESLFASHVWGDRLEPLRDYVRVVMNPGSTLPGGRPYPLALSASKRRLLVAMTWPERLGKPAVPARALHRGLKAGVAVPHGGPLWQRTYNDISDHVAQPPSRHRRRFGRGLPRRRPPRCRRSRSHSRHRHCHRQPAGRRSRSRRVRTTLLLGNRA